MWKGIFLPDLDTAEDSTYFPDAADRPVGLPDRICRKPDRPGFPFFPPVGVYALGDASRIRCQADRALLPGIVARLIVPVRHLVTTLFPTFFQGKAIRFKKRRVRVVKLVISRVNDHDILA